MFYDDVRNCYPIDPSYMTSSTTGVTATPATIVTSATPTNVNYGKPQIGLTPAGWASYTINLDPDANEYYNIIEVLDAFPGDKTAVKVMFDEADQLPYLNQLPYIVGAAAGSPTGSETPNGIIANPHMVGATTASVEIHNDHQGATEQAIVTVGIVNFATDVAITTDGHGYTSATATLAIVGTLTGTNATIVSTNATVPVGGYTIDDSVTLSTAGSKYSFTPAVTATGATDPGGGATEPTFKATVGAGGIVTKVEVVTVGDAVAGDTLTFTIDGAQQKILFGGAATANATVACTVAAGEVTVIPYTSQLAAAPNGSGYSVAPTITISAPNP